MAEGTNLREEYKRSIEKMAYEKLKAIPVDEAREIFSIPTNAVNYLNIDESFSDEIFLKDVEIIGTIKNFNVGIRDSIMVFPGGWDEAGNSKLLITSGNNPHLGTAAFKVNSELGHEDREKIVNMIAYHHKHKEVTVVFVTNNTFENIEAMINDDKSYFVPELLR